MLDREWTELETSLLRKMLAENQTLAMCAIKLDRELQDIRAKARSFVVGTPARGVWTSLHQAQLEARLIVGEDRKDIAIALGVSYTTINQRCRMMPDYEDKVWPPDRLERFRRMREEGLSLNECARRLNTSKNACVGKARRAGFPFGENPVKKSTKKVEVVPSPIVELQMVRLPDMRVPQPHWLRSAFPVEELQNAG